MRRASRKMESARTGFGALRFNRRQWTGTPSAAMRGPIVPSSPRETTTCSMVPDAADRSLSSIVSAPPVDRPVITCMTRMLKNIAVFGNNLLQIKPAQRLNGRSGTAADSDDGFSQGAGIFRRHHGHISYALPYFSNAAGTIADYNRRSQRQGLKQYVRQAFITRGQYECVGVLYVAPWIRLKTQENNV